MLQGCRLRYAGPRRSWPLRHVSSFEIVAAPVFLCSRVKHLHNILNASMCPYTISLQCRSAGQIISQTADAQEVLKEVLIVPLRRCPAACLPLHLGNRLHRYSHKVIEACVFSAFVRFTGETRCFSSSHRISYLQYRTWWDGRSWEVPMPCAAPALKHTVPAVTMVCHLATHANA